jgi:hypothetical protein
MVYGVQVLGDPFIILWYDNIISLKIIFFTAGSCRVMPLFEGEQLRSILQYQCF